MSWHLCAYRQSIAQNALLEIAALADTIFPINAANRFIPPVDVKLFWALAMGTTINRLRITTPKLRQLNPTYVRPVAQQATGGNNSNVMHRFYDPVTLKAEEDIIVEALQSSAGAEVELALLGLGTDIDPVPPGEIFLARATSTTAATANAWSLISYALENALPQGTYGCVGIEHQSTNGIAIRGVFDNQYPRPGWPSVAAIGSRLNYDFYQYNYGVMGRFRTYSLPRLEVLAGAADAAHEIYLHLIYLGNSPLPTVAWQAR